MPNSAETANGPARHVLWPRMAQFNAADPDTWMKCAESFLRMSQVTDPTEKCLYIISKMDSIALKEISDLIADLSVVSEQGFEDLKNKIVKRFGESQTIKTQRLLEGEEMGDRTPSQFLRHLRSLAGRAMSDEVLRVIWTKGLPTDMQAAVVAKRDTPLETLADIADLVAENTRLRCVRPPPAVTAITPADSAHERITQLEGEISEVKGLLRNISDRLQNPNAVRDTRPRQRSHSRGHARRRSSSRTRPEDWLCWYHWKFGPKANTCVQPCAYKAPPPQGNASGSH